MILIKDLKKIAAQLKAERSIELGDLVGAIEKSLVAAYARNYGQMEGVLSVLNAETGECRIIATKSIVDAVNDETIEISIEQVRAEGLLGAVGDTVEVDVTPESFGRVAIQAAKNVILQMINESEKAYVYDKFKEKIGQLVNGVVQRVEGMNYLVNLGDVEATLTRRDQIPGETLHSGDHVRVFLSDITLTNRGPILRISRSCPEFLIELFKLEVPEIKEKNIIEINAIARDAGMRSKVAVYSNHQDVGAVGTCVGHMGTRIQNILKALSNEEKVDILNWSVDPIAFIANSMKPATVSKVLITSSDSKTAIVVVPQDQLSLAIGKKGVNVRLAVRLTGWKIDILSEEKYAEEKDSLSVEAVDSSLTARLENEKPSGSASLADNIRAELASSQADDDEEDDETPLSQLAHMYGFEPNEFVSELAKRSVTVNESQPLDDATIAKIRAAFNQEDKACVVDKDSTGDN
ncbi:transcription termination/antitermination protein NusA [bacterium]|nr:transcription termination/antitermination protein NusA [bacterium]